MSYDFKTAGKAFTELMIGNIYNFAINIGIKIIYPASKTIRKISG